MTDVLFKTRVGDMTIPQLRKRLGLTEGPLLPSSLNAGSYPTRSIHGDKLLIPAARMTGGAKTIASNTFTQYDQFSAETFDTDNMVRSGVADRITVSTPGIYLVVATVTWDNASTANDRITYISRNGTILSGTTYNAAAVSTLATHVDHVLLDKDQYLGVQVLQNSGGDLDIVSVALSCSFVTSI